MEEYVTECPHCGQRFTYMAGSTSQVKPTSCSNPDCQFKARFGTDPNKTWDKGYKPSVD